MSRKRRQNEAFSLSFLDVICCGFGAIILLLMITKTVEPILLERATVAFEAQVKAFRIQLFEIRGETKILNRDLNAKHEQLSLMQKRIAVLNAELNQLKDQYANASLDETVNERIAGQLNRAKQRLTQEMKRLLGEKHERKNSLIGGIPVDSEYIIFVIDTSGSMFNYGWTRMLEEFSATLAIYPKVKGIQVLNDMGNYMFPRYRSKWIPDTPARRQAIMTRLRRWNAFSNSSPVEGLTRAIRTFYAKDKKISIYVFGDEFTGESISTVVKTIDRINRQDKTGKRLVRIHAVGFPVQFSRPRHQQVTGIRFATLMRELSHKNGGTFVGLNDYR
ncbi:MAG: VWA domain-containing protein [Spongiibacteraceae bacterium]|nr:VWA domain-containing protein [Spongiibacteraceae bacterium]